MHKAMLAGLALAFATPALAQDVVDEGARGFGIGAQIGSPTGLSLIYRPGEVSAVQAGIGWNILPGGMHANVDYLHNVAIIDPEGADSFTMPAYVGAGGKLLVHEGDEFGDLDAGVRIPVGMALLPDDAPFDGFVEVAPVVGVVPEIDIGFDAALGARLYL